MDPERTWAEKSTAVIQAAVLAPSSHNTQPWIFRVSETAVDLVADGSRALPANDPEDRELVISCGCALLNLRLAALEEGFDPEIQLLPESGDPRVLARVRLSAVPKMGKPEMGKEVGRDGVSAPELVPFMETRRTVRDPFKDEPVNRETLHVLEEAASAEGARLQPVLQNGNRGRLAALIAEGDRVQWADASWRRELAAWMRPRKRGEGLTVPLLAAPIARLVIRTFDMGKRMAGKDRELAEDSPLLAVLNTGSDEREDWLTAGQALQRVLLAGCREGLQASYLNQPVQVQKLRPRLQELVGGGTPQVVLRLGFPKEDPPASPRRPLEAVMEWVH